MKKLVITFGVIAGVIVAAMMFITMPMAESGDTSMGMVIGYITMLIALSTIFVAIKMYRDKHSSGEIKFGKAFLIGIGISVIACAIYAITWEIYLKTSGLGVEGYMESYFKAQTDMMKAKGATAEEIAKTAKEAKDSMVWYSNTVLRFLFTMFGEMFPVGLLVSLISAAILRKKNVLPATN